MQRSIFPLDKKVAHSPWPTSSWWPSAGHSLDVKLLIMDEPTTALTKKEVDALLAVIKDLNKQGVATLFISHKLNELMMVADRITVLRDGKKIGCYLAAEIDAKKVDYLMTGTTSSYTPYSFSQEKIGTPTLPLQTSRGQLPRCRPAVTRGIVITRALGSGRTNSPALQPQPPTSGTCMIDEEPSLNRQAVHEGRLCPENRLADGRNLARSTPDQS